MNTAIAAPSQASAGIGAPVLEVREVSKAFPGVRALDRVSFDLRPGEVHALCGENGAGKSTLMKILAGSYQPDSGALFHRGTEVRLPTPLAARQRGILLIHQEISLVPQLSVAENLFLGSLPGRFGGRLDRKTLYRDAERVLQECGYALRPSDLVESLSVAQQQMVEIARASAFRCSVVIFDEPTASLTDGEAAVLFKNIERLKQQGVGVIYISHKMKEIFALSDRVSVLRDGEARGTLQTRQTDEAEVTRLMIGRSLDQYFDRAHRRFGAEVLRVEDLSVAGRVQKANLSIRAGEVLGLYGLVGAGRSELVEAVFGLRPRMSGRIFWNGREVEMNSPRQAIEQGLALVPEDRKRQGLVLGMGGRHNMALASLRTLSRGGFMRRSRERALYADYRARLKIRAADDGVAVGTLSGGNQQKVVLAKWLAREPKLLIFDEPTRGIDVGAKAEIHALITRMAEGGAAVLLISSEMPEVMGLSHRILTMYRGAITGEVDEADFSEARLVAAVMPSDGRSPAA
jgi:ABC-type sugar transport system ATPase subunit